jgi:hypothetical protein
VASSSLESPIVSRPYTTGSAAAWAAESGWHSLYRVAGAAALLMAVFIPVQIAVFVVSPPPSTVLGWFTLFQQNRLMGLLDMDLLLIVDQALMGLLLLALYVLLRRASPSAMLVALAAALVGIAAYFASATAFNMLTLSDQYAAAASDAERTALLAVGQTMMSIWTGTAFDVGYVLEGASMLIISVVMLRSGLFGRVTAWVGIVLGVLSLLPPTAGTLGMIFALGSLIPLEIWDILVARRLFQLAGSESNAAR